MNIHPQLPLIERWLLCRLDVCLCKIINLLSHTEQPTSLLVINTVYRHCHVPLCCLIMVTSVATGWSAFRQDWIKGRCLFIQFCRMWQNVHPRSQKA